MSTIWTDEVLGQFAEDSEQDIVQEVSCLYHRFFLATVAGVSVYTLPEKVKSLERVTWRGRKVWPMNWEDLQTITPHTVFVDASHKIETSESRPMWYALHPTNIHDIRFYPTPNETFVDTGDPYSPDTGARCIISCMRNIDQIDALATIPTYVRRRLLKAGVLWRCFEKEGEGQNLRAAAFYKAKFDFLIKRFTSINEGSFISKRYSLDEGSLDDQGHRYPRPTLPPNFERVRY